MAKGVERGWLEEVNYSKTGLRLRFPTTTTPAPPFQVSLWADSILHCNGPPGSTTFLPPYLPFFISVLVSSSISGLTTALLTFPQHAIIPPYWLYSLHHLILASTNHRFTLLLTIFLFFFPPQHEVPKGFGFWIKRHRKRQKLLRHLVLRCFLGIKNNNIMFSIMYFQVHCRLVDTQHFQTHID